MDINTSSEDIQNSTHQDFRAPSEGTGSAPEPAFIRVPYITAPSAPPANGPQVRKSRKKRTGVIGLMLSAMLVLGMLLGGAGAEAVMLVAGTVSTHSVSSSTSAASATSSSVVTSTGSAQLAAQTSQATINSVYAKVSPSIVMITANVQQNYGRFSASGQAIGTGMVLDTNGDILTNYHVISGASSLTVKLSDGSQYSATVVGTAPQNDLAVIKATAPSSSLVPVTLGDSSTVKVGDAVITVGYPYGLDQSVTSGIVSGLNRDGTSSDTGVTLTGMIQVDAAINPGNSGGPLLNAVGEVVGMNTMIESPVNGFTGVGLSIPVNQVKALLQQLEQGGQVN